MPELPEIHTIATDIKENLLGWDIKEVNITRGYKTTPNNQTYSQKLVGARIIKVGRVGKNVVIKLSNENFLTFHLAMTGRILLQKPNTPIQPHQKVEIKLSNGSESALLRFCDIRMFGKTEVLTADQMGKFKQKYGPDLISQEVTAKLFATQLKKKNTAVKNALLEQSIIAGIGNIYATDALWMSEIHPETKTSTLTQEQIQKLLKAAKEILLEGIKHRGSTLPDEAYVDIFGKSGGHQNYFRIYGKNTCPKCKTKVSYKKINGRGTYFCPSCQK